MLHVYHAYGKKFSTSLSVLIADKQPIALTTVTLLSGKGWLSKPCKDKPVVFVFPDTLIHTTYSLCIAAYKFYVKINGITPA